MREPAGENALVEQFKALAHPLRLRILEALAQCERNVGEIEQATGIGQPALSQQLGVLRKAGLVETRKEAKLVFYRLAPSELGELSAVLAALAPSEPCPTPVPASAPSPAPGVAHFARLS
ncbi:MAG: ArsR/SmtB family transcription factor [Erythrobacter sp.]